MNERPSPSEDEEALLKLQKEFLASASANRPSATIKRPDKRKTDGDGGQGRDIVKMEGIEPSIPMMSSSIPAKKSKFQSELSAKLPHREQQPRSTHSSSTSFPRRDQKPAEEENMEELLDKHDKGLAAVLTTIIERDTRNEMYIAPVLGKQAFPSVRHMDRALKGQNSLPEGKTKKKSLFAQQVEAHSAKHFGVEAAPARSFPTSQTIVHTSGGASTSEHVLSRLHGPCVVEGVGLSASNSQTESQKIHEENVEKLANLSEAEILEEQRKLVEMIDPKLVEFLKNKKRSKEEEIKSGVDSSAKEVTFAVQNELKNKQKSPVEPELQIPVKPSKKWVNMSTVERDKLEWMKDLPPPSSTSFVTGRQARFDFSGNLLAVDAEIPVNMGLHHHGDEPERAGYTLEELFQLARSSHLQQRSLALHTLARIVEKAGSGYLSGQIETPIVPAVLAGGVVMLLRWALDDSVEGTVVAATDALHALICSPLDEEAVNTTWAWYQGNLLPALTPAATLEKEATPEDLDEENQEEETDGDIVKRDVVQALVTRMELLIRVRYILDTMRPQAITVIHLLNLLSRTAQHSSTLAYEVMKCPGLMELIVKEFLPTAWSAQESGKPVSHVYGLPVPAAMRLIRVLCQAGRNIASILVAKYHLNVILLRHLTVPTSDLQLPYKEAVHLQVESLATWRVCATYGLCIDTYFDMYSNILPAVGKLVSWWETAQNAGQFSNVETPSPGLDLGLICVLEKILCVAGSARQQQGFEQSSEMAPMTNLATPAINWTHVTPLFQPLKVCVAQMLNEIGSSYPTKKHSLVLPTACVNFLATYYELQGRQSGVDEVSCLDGIENFCAESVIPFLSSYGLTVMLENLYMYSNILETSATVPSEFSPNLPTLLVASVAEKEMTPSASESQHWTANMPILRSHSPFGFLTALLRLVLALCKRHKAMISKLINCVVDNKDLRMYMKKISGAGESPFNAAHLTRGENLFQYYWLKCCTLKACPDMSLAHCVSLRLLCRVQHGDEHLVHDLISTVVFSPNFLHEGEETQLASEALASMSLSETLHLKSATQEEVSVNQCQLLQEMHSALAKIRGHFLMAFSGKEKAVQDSRVDQDCKLMPQIHRNLFMGNPVDISTQLLKGAGESLMPRDWVFMPLIHVYNQAAQSRSVSGASMSPQAIAMVTSVLQWTYALEIWRPVEMEKISATIRLSRIMCAFIAGSDLFLEKPVNQYLAGLLRVFTTPKLLGKLDFEEKIPGLTSFYDLYQEFLDHYEAVSFGDPVFGLYVLLPLQQKHSSLLRKAVWGERRKMLRTLTVPLVEMLIPLQNYLQPDEMDTELLQLYLSALITKSVQPSWSPVMYLLAVHHINRFIYTTQDDGHQPVRDRMWTQVLALENQLSDVIYFKQADICKPRGIEVYEKLPQNRQTTLERHKTKEMQ